jgi:hypothetical protein
MQLTRPKYFFPGRAPSEIVVGPIEEAFGQTTTAVGLASKIGKCGQATAALEGLVVNRDVYAMSMPATAPMGCGTLVEFIPNPIPNGYQTGMPSSGWNWHRFKMDDGGHAFIGWPEDEPIGPENFERETMISGAIVSDDNGDSWSIPVARARDSELGKLPTRWVMTEDGLTSKVTKEMKPIWEFGGEVMAYLRALNAFQLDQVPPPETWKDPWAFHAALRVLGVQYHIGQAEMVLLDAIESGIMSINFVAAILHGFTDYQAYIEYHYQKKTREAATASGDSSNSSSGEQAA